MSDNRKEMTGGQIVVEYLVREKVPYTFAIPGHGNTALIDSFVDRQDEITLVPAMHEQGASHMADGYYRTSGQVAAVLYIDRSGCNEHPYLLVSLQPSQTLSLNCSSQAVSQEWQNQS